MAQLNGAGVLSTEDIAISQETQSVAIQTTEEPAMQLVQRKKLIKLRSVPQMPRQPFKLIAPSVFIMIHKKVPA